MLLQAVNFTGYRLIRRTLHGVQKEAQEKVFGKKTEVSVQYSGSIYKKTTTDPSKNICTRLTCLIFIPECSISIMSIFVAVFSILCCGIAVWATPNDPLNI